MAAIATGFINPLGSGYTKTQSHNAGSQYLYDSTSDWEYHMGEDWANGSSGGNVSSIGNGRVTFAGALGGWGNMVVIEHTMGDGQIVTSIYAHLRSINVTAQSDVAVGTKIGEVGTTGFSTGPHLHFSIYLGARSASSILATTDSPDPDIYSGYVDPSLFIAANPVGSGDIPGTTQTSAVLAINGNQTSSIESAGDSDWFKVSLQAGQAYSFAVRGADSGLGTLADPKIRIRDPNGNALTAYDNDDWGGTRDARISGFVAPTTGTYYIVAYAYGTGTGTYTVSATTSVPAYNRIVGSSSNNNLLGTNGSDAIYGLAGNDVISAGAGGDLLIGGSGNDVLTGGSGADRFVFNSSLGLRTVDQITDFNPVEDKIRLDNDIFLGLSTGSLAAFRFVANTSGFATTSSHRIMYETDAGRIFFDADGLGGQSRVLIASLGANLAIAADDFLIY